MASSSAARCWWRSSSAGAARASTRCRACSNADINPVLGFVLFSAILSLIIYLVVDLIYFAIDPRIRG